MGIISRLETRSTSQTIGHPRDPVIADWFGGGVNSAAGFPVTPETAMRASAVFSCVRVLAESIASLPLKMFKRLPDNGKELARGMPQFNMVGRSPNSWMTRFDFLERGTAHICLRGVNYAKIVGNRRGERQLIPMHPDRVRAELLDSGKVAYEYQPKNGSREILLQDEVLRVPFMSLEDLRPLSPIGVMREAIGANLATQDYAARFFANDARPTGGYVTWDTGNKFKDEEEEKKFRENWQKYMTGPNRHKTAFLKSGMKFNELGMSNSDAQFLEAKKAQRSEIAGLFLVPPHMIGELDKATFSNIEHQTIQFVTYTLTSWLCRWEQSLSRDLLTPGEQDDFFFEFLVDGLMRGDATARANYFKTAITNGWMNRNEVRAIENLNKKLGLDKFIVPMNMTSSDQLGESKKAKKNE